jgi:hypothetical protein
VRDFVLCSFRLYRFVTTGTYSIDRVAPDALSPYPSGWAPSGNLKAWTQDADMGGGVDPERAIEASVDEGPWVEAIAYNAMLGVEFPL